MGDGGEGGVLGALPAPIARGGGSPGCQHELNAGARRGKQRAAGGQARGAAFEVTITERVGVVAQVHEAQAVPRGRHADAGDGEREIVAPSRQAERAVREVVGQREHADVDRGGRDQRDGRREQAREPHVRFEGYDKRIAGMVVRGFGRYKLHRPMPQSTFEFWSDDRRSPIRRGVGLWRYVSAADGSVEFRTSYTYEVRWGLAGRVLDRVILRRWFQRETERSFARLVRDFFAGQGSRAAAVAGRRGHRPQALAA